MSEKTKAKGVKILITDDDKFLIDMYSIKFSEHGFEVEVATSGEEAIKTLEGGFGPDICLVDLIMPGMDGFNLINTIRERNLAPGASIIILTNLGQKEDIEKGLGLGVDGYIIKASATPTEVVNKVEQIAQETHTKK